MPILACDESLLFDISMSSIVLFIASHPAVCIRCNKQRPHHQWQTWHINYKAEIYCNYHIASISDTKDIHVRAGLCLRLALKWGGWVSAPTSRNLWWCSVQMLHMIKMPKQLTIISQKYGARQMGAYASKRKHFLTVWLPKKMETIRCHHTLLV